MNTRLGYIQHLYLPKTRRVGGNHSWEKLAMNKQKPIWLQYCTKTPKKQSEQTEPSIYNTGRHTRPTGGPIGGGVSYPSAEMQSAYSIVPADRASMWRWTLAKCCNLCHCWSSQKTISCKSRLGLEHMTVLDGWGSTGEGEGVSYIFYEY